MRVTYDQFSRKRTAFIGNLAGGLGLALGAHLLAPLFFGDELIRLCLVVAFFTGLATAAWSFSTPFAEYFSARMRWRFADAGAAIGHSVELYVIRVARLAQGPAWLLSTVSMLTLLWVLSLWPIGAPLRPFGWLLGGTAALGLFGLPLVLAWNASRLKETLSLGRTISEQARASGYVPASARQAAAEAGSANEAPVVATAPLQFRAGGVEWYWSDFYKNAAIFGQSGSGKTVCVLNPLLEGLLASARAADTVPAGLILDPKGDFREKIGLLMRRHGMSDALAVLDPTDPAHSICWNPLDSTDSAMEIAGRFAGVMETLSESGDKDRYFIDAGTTFVTHMITILRCLHPERPPSLGEIYDCAMSDAELETVYYQVPDTAGREAERAVKYMMREWSTLAADTRSVVRSFMSNMMGPFLSGPYEALFSGKSTVTLGQALDQGRLVYVHLPLASAEVMARVVATFVKLEFYREVLRRPDKARPSFFLCDEFQAFFTAKAGRGDADAFERTRQSNHANIIAFQNLNALYKQTQRKEPVDNLLGNCATQIFLRNTDRATNEYASKLFGEQVETLVGVSANIGGGGKAAGASTSVGGATQYGARVRENVFSQLAVPSRPDGIAFAESMTHIGARAAISHRRQRWNVHAITE